MRQLVRVVQPLVLAAAALLALWQTMRARSEALSFRAERARVKREFVERALVARGLAAGRAREASEESRALVRWYFDEVQAARNRHPREKPGPTLEALLEQRAKAKPEEKATLEEFYRYAEERLGALKAGRLEPLQSAAAAGLRLDLLAVQPGQNPATKERGVRVDFALWGVPRRTERDPQAGPHAPERGAMAAVFKQLAFRFLDAERKPYGEMVGSGEPYLKLADPERFADDFPPGILFGTWWVEPFPREAARVAVAVELQLPGVTAAALQASFAFDAPVAEDWKLPPGEAFRGETREDPSLAPAPAGKKK
jgi:hypothetical protein